MTEATASETKLSWALIAALLVLLVVWGFAIATWGYGAIIVPALALTATSLISLIFVTRG
ncbi:hypothetical protein SAMN04515647_3982 [Cohaesibacter sp. ES.047]|uniref:hypothetical protein n=1 Tax=Cohaesibacter sp. ES.047 TaxID=1798205 RepID=UPI000BB96B52|nr:hypothetical protein [Cohaesibacter sp. ES.047]SNY93670.1 hypothetical protein SAMN04515647_3982 [Cohaesibacter sp. ES.047]